MSAKTQIYQFLKLLGLFQVSKFVNRRKSPILCYHGISATDEHEFIPGNFMRFETFKKRMTDLRETGYKFISLDSLLEKKEKNELNINEVAITIDDGFLACFDEMIPFLEAEKIPATLYFTTKNAENPYPIFRLAFNYLIWKIKAERLDVKGIGLLKKLNLEDSINLLDLDERWKFIKLIEENFDFEKRNIILTNVEELFDIKLTEEQKRVFTIADPARLKDFKFIDLQLHTHEHSMQGSSEDIKNDLKLNKEKLSPYSTSELKHFCYPSGYFESRYFKVLNDLDIKSATTCEQALVASSTENFQIPRFIDSEKRPFIVLLAQLSGFQTLTQRLTQLIRH